ncbi:MAG: Na+/H+ antiporter subunit E [Thermomicrobiales bacterium]
MRFIGSVIVLTVIYALALASVHPWDLAMGAAFASLVYLLFRSWLFPFGPPDELPSQNVAWKRALHAPAFIGMVVLHILRGTWTVLLIVLRVRPIRQGIVGIPYGERRESGRVVMAYADTLSPGSVIVEFDDAAQIAWTHLIDASDPDGIREDAQELYDRWQKDVFP